MKDRTPKSRVEIRAKGIQPIVMEYRGRATDEELANFVAHFEAANEIEVIAAEVIRQSNCDTLAYYQA